ncbi:MAG: 1-deoxy-D-xylulose-5-phosphate synthase [Muribaculaceae bacterium]|nr:1-deoxy-D-xylulose-5-phosphate synthase [Muribaculaceae bacterium]
MEQSDSTPSPQLENKQFPILSKIDSPSDLRSLPLDKLPALCSEIRKFLISNLSQNPGHFASSMGAVEIIVALHYVFDTPNDRIVYDVGHQAYAHKIITGRRDRFATQRTQGGISGFPSPSESQYDTFTAGHAGNSISAALGMAIADKLTLRNENRKTVAVIGDASISCGLAFEGLNNASNSPNDLLIILNDNDMSIDNNVGALHKYLTELTTSQPYNKLRYKLSNFFHKKGVLDEQGKKRFIRLNNSLKAFISHQQNIFEGLNIRYFGPSDGHDVIRLVKTLQEIKDMKGPRLLHLNTVKGKGFPEAEKDPTTWHAPGKFDPLTGERPGCPDTVTPPKWQDVFGEALVELAKNDENIVAVTAAMPSGTSVSKMMQELPERTFDTGISEGHAVTFAGGLASAGKHPFVAIYSAFLQRGYDNIIHDVAISSLPVTFCIDRAGLVGEDGVTHHGLFDLAYLNCIPGMIVSSPADEETLRNLMLTASKYNGPMAIRYPRGSSNAPAQHPPFRQLEIGKGRIVSEYKNNNTAILTIGPLLNEAIKANQLLPEEKRASIYDLIWLKPLDKELLNEIANQYSHVITLEDGSKIGGFGESVFQYLKQIKPELIVDILAVPDKWVGHATPAQLRRECGIDAQAICDIINREP